MRERAAWKKTAWKEAAWKDGRGLTLMGLIMVLFILVVLLLFGMRVLPAYIEYGTAKKAINAIARDGPGASRPPEVRRQFDARALIDNIEVVTATANDIREEGG